MAGPGLPPSWDSELSELFAEEPELLETARRLRASRPQPELGENFKPYLRARLMDAAATRLRPRGLRRLLPRPVLFGWAGVGVGVALIAAVAVTWLGYNPTDRVQVVSFNSAVDGQADVRPDDVIRISFNQPMDQAAVVAGLHIHPATAVTTSWEGDTLVVTPTHHLAMNTPYTVTIPQQSARSQSGQTAPTAIAITFGTVRTAPSGPSPAPAPVLALRTVAVADSDRAGAVVGADGSVVVTSAVTPAPTPSPSANPSTSASPVAGLTLPAVPSLTAPAAVAPAAGTASPGASPSPGAGSGLLRIGADGAATRLGPPVAAVAVSTRSGSIAEVRPDGGGGAAIVVTDANGATPTTLTTTDTPSTPIAWGGDDLHPTVVYVAGGLVHSVDLQRTVKTLASRQPVVPGQSVILAPDGAFAYLGPPPPPASPSPSPSASPTASPSPSASPASPGPTPPAAGGEVVDLRTGSAHPLPDSAAVAAFSADGSRVVWVAAQSSGPQLDVAPAAGGDVTSVLVPGSATGSTVDRLAVDADGGRAAYVLTGSDGSGQLRVVGLPDGTVLATGAATALHPTLSPRGDTVAVLVPDGTGAFPVQVAAVPQPAGTASPSPAPSAVPGDVGRLLSAVIAAQTASPVDQAALSGLAAGGAAGTLAGGTPPGLDRGYVIRVAADPTRPGAYDAHVRLVRDPAKDSQGNVQPAQFADEDLTVQPSGAAYQVAAAATTPLQTEPSGPQVLAVQGAGHVFRVGFDSDLRPDTVGGAVTVRDAAGTSLPVSAVYDPDSRAIVVTVSSGTPATLQIGTGLLDVDGQPLAAPYSTPVSGAGTPAAPAPSSPGPTPAG